MWRSILEKINDPPVLGMNRRNLELVSPRNARQHFPIADDKLLAKVWLERAGVAVAPTLATFESFYDVGQWQDKLAGLEEFVIKPARGSGGRGILVISKRNPEAFVTAGGHEISETELVKHLGDIVFGVYALDKADTAFVEPRLIPHPFFADLYADGLSDMRLIFADDKFAMCMIRVPTRASDGRANLHQGAVGIAVDPFDGRTFRAVQHRKRIERHPETGHTLLGKQVPRWQEVIDIATAAARALPLKYLGVDMVMDVERGPSSSRSMHVRASRFKTLQAARCFRCFESRASWSNSW